MDAVTMKNLALAGAAAVGSAAAHALGGMDAVLRMLVALMAADYLTGVAVAALWKKSPKSESGALDSRAGFKGLAKKGAILLLVWIGQMLDTATGTDYIRTAVVLFFCGNEGLSLLENLGLMGVPFPAFLRQALEVLRDQGAQGEKQ